MRSHNETWIEALFALYCMTFRRKLQQRVQELQEQVEGANGKIGSLEKVRHKLLGEIDDAQVDVERV